MRRANRRAGVTGFNRDLEIPALRALSLSVLWPWGVMQGHIVFEGSYLCYKNPFFFSATCKMLRARDPHPPLPLLYLVLFSTFFFILHAFIVGKWCLSDVSECHAQINVHLITPINKWNSDNDPQKGEERSCERFTYFHLLSSIILILSISLLSPQFHMHLLGSGGAVRAASREGFYCDWICSLQGMMQGRLYVSQTNR